MEKIICIVCGQNGGKFRFIPGKGYAHVASCARPDEYRDKAKSTFPFTTRNLSGDPNQSVTVQSLRHLRQLESRHGVASEVYNNNSNNWSDYRGDRG